MAERGNPNRGIKVRPRVSSGESLCVCSHGNLLSVWHKLCPWAKAWAVKSLHFWENGGRGWCREGGWEGQGERRLKQSFAGGTTESQPALAPLRLPLLQCLWELLEYPACSSWLIGSADLVGHWTYCVYTASLGPFLVSDPVEWVTTRRLKNDRITF